VIMQFLRTTPPPTPAVIMQFLRTASVGRARHDRRKCMITGNVDGQCGGAM
jgi:hypothetical protein